MKNFFISLNIGQCEDRGRRKGEEPGEDKGEETGDGAEKARSQGEGRKGSQTLEMCTPLLLPDLMRLSSRELLK